MNIKVKLGHEEFENMKRLKQMHAEILSKKGAIRHLQIVNEGADIELLMVLRDYAQLNDLSFKVTAV